MRLFSWFGFWLFVLCSLTVTRGQSNLICSSQPIVATAGDDVILACRLHPPISASSRAVEWTRPGLDLEYIHVHQDGRLVHQSQNPLYKDRTALFEDQLINGIVSLKLLRVKLSDAGNYKCFIPSLRKEASIQLIVGQSNLICSSQPIVATAGDDVILPCRLHPPISASSRAVEWTRPGLDPEYIHVHQDGRLVHQSQNPLFNYRTALFVDQLINGNVSLKLLRVKLSDAGNYKCFIPSLWKEASIQLIVEDSFVAPCSRTYCLAFSVVLSLLFVLAVVLLVWKWRQNTIVSQPEIAITQQPLMEAERSREHLESEIKKMEEELEKKKEEEKDMTQVIGTLSELKKELEKQKEKLTDQMQKAERLAEENYERIKSLEEEGDKTANKGQEYIKLKEILTENRWNLDERTQEQQQLQLNAQNLMKKTMDEVIRFEEKKKKVENDMEQIKEQLEENQRKLESERGGRK